jgi:hypothetical protein
MRYRSYRGVVGRLCLIVVCVQLFAGCEWIRDLFGPSPIEEPPDPCLTSVLGCPSSVGNDFSSSFSPRIGATSVFCTNAIGQPVAFVPNLALNDVGRASQSAIGPIIELNPNVLAQLPQKLQLFWYGHECGHHVLGHTLSLPTLTNESAADCWAIQTGKRQGLFTRQQVAAFEPYFRNNPGSPWGHLPGPQRAALLVGCFDAG